MPEKLIDKVKRISRDLADSVRAEIELRETVVSLSQENKQLKLYAFEYLREKEGVTNPDQALTFLKGYHEGKKKETGTQMTFSFGKNKSL